MPLITLVAITLTTMVHHDYSCKWHIETHGNFTKCHVSQIVFFSNQILPHVNLLNLGDPTKPKQPNLESLP
jgi:hypothetical protein